MSEPTPNPKRLSCLPETEDTLGIGRMFRNARQLPDEELPTLRWRLRTSQRLRAIRPRLFLRIGLTVGIVFCMGGVVGAVVGPFWGRRQPAVAASPPPVAAPAAKHRKPRASNSATVTPAPSEPIGPETTPAAHEPEPVADEPKPATSAKHRASVRVALQNGPTPAPPPSIPPSAAPLPVSTPSPIAVEQAMVGQAMKTLRDGHDARTALALLAQHAQRFPNGALGAEATILRIEALLALGQRDEALSILDTVPLASLPNSDGQLVVRGELRAASGRWREAKQDFDGVLRARNLPAANARARTLQERALWGRAAARSRLGDQEGARADLDLYLRDFPGGRFAGPATSLLKAAP